MKRIQLVLAAAGILALAGGTVVLRRARAAALPAEPQASACVSYVPREWGQYKGGSSQSGLAFEDSNGTLRFVTNLPCGAIPVVSLEIRRPPAKN